MSNETRQLASKQKKLTLDEAQLNYTNAFKAYRNAARAYALAMRDRHEGDKDDPELVAKYQSTKALLGVTRAKVSQAGNVFVSLQEEEYENEKKAATR